MIISSPEEGKEEKSFTFDNCYGLDSTQVQVYRDIGLPMVEQSIEGFNGTIFAYGQTGSGKTHTMMGYDSSPGIIPQMNSDLFRKVSEKLASLDSTNEGTSIKSSGACETKFMITVSFLEIYNEIIKDLLNPKEGNALKIRENKELGIYVEGLCELIVREPSDIMRLLEQGNTVRKVAATNMNEQSSRSHSCFTIRVEQKTVTELEGGVTRQQLLKSKLNLVDLAGSERASKTGASGATLKEGSNINMSLMALGNVINALAEGTKGKKRHIPYRDSQLTRLLQESLGGNAATIMIAAISPADYNFDETLSTLKYANRAKSIENEVSRNEDLTDRMIRDLQAEIQKLKEQLGSGGAGGVGGVSVDEDTVRKLQEAEEAQRRSWEERERLSAELENQRNANIAASMSVMMKGVKDQKLTHMKVILYCLNMKI